MVTRHLSAVPDTRPAVSGALPEWRSGLSINFRSGMPRAQQYQVMSAFIFKCAGCGTPLDDGEEVAPQPIIFTTAYAAEDTDCLGNQGWGQVGEWWYCPNCQHTCWETDEMPRRGMAADCPDCAPAQPTT